MKYYDKLIFEISRPGRVGYSLPKNWESLTPTLSLERGLSKQPLIFNL